MPPVARPDTTCWMKISISVSEVRAADRVVFSQHVRRSFHDDASRLEEKHVVGQIQGERGVLFDARERAGRLAPPFAKDGKVAEHALEIFAEVAALAAAPRAQLQIFLDG